MRVFRVAAGCGGGTADVSGKVEFKGKPVTAGTVTVAGPDGVPVSAGIRSDGTYSVSGVAPGAAKVGVAVPRAGTPRRGDAAREGGRGGAAEKAPPPPTPEAVPTKYGDPNSSGLTTELSVGSNTYNIELK